MSETAWLYDRLRLALFAPRRFADVLSREHFGLAGLLVAGAAGSAISLAVDLLLVTANGADPGRLVNRFLVDALLVGIRAVVLAAVIGTAVALGLRALLRAEAPSIDQLVTAVSFGMAPLIAAFPIAALAALAPALLGAAVVACAALALRVLYGVAIELRALAPPAAAAVGFVVAVAAASFGFSDLLDHARFVAYAPFPKLAPPLAAPPATGTPWVRAGMSLVIPPEWELMTTTTPGTLAQYQRGHDTLAVVTKAGGPLLSTDEVADRIGETELRGVSDRTSRRDVVRIGDAVVVDDRVVGTYEGSRLAVRQVTTLVGTTGYAVILRAFDPSDPERVLDEAGGIAATWRIARP